MVEPVEGLSAHDEIRFAQTRNADGTYTVDEIQLVIPSVAGQVTAVDGSTITVKRLDGTTETIHVDASTTYTVAGVTTATLADIKVGAFIVAQGTERADGSLDAAAVHSGFEKRFGRHGDGTGRPPTPTRPPRARRPPARLADIAAGPGPVIGQRRNRRADPTRVVAFILAADARS